MVKLQNVQSKGDNSKTKSQVILLAAQLMTDPPAKFKLHGILQKQQPRDHLTLKAPPIICSRRQFQILPLFQK